MIHGDYVGYCSEDTGDNWIKAEKLPDEQPLPIHQWIAAVENRLKGVRDAPPPLDHHRCRFGQWLEAEGLGGQDAPPALQAIAVLHREIHTLAAELLELQLQGGNSEALARLGELHTLRHRLLEHQAGLLQDRC